MPPMAEEDQNEARELRKLRKKLRQIEHLATLGRDLNEEEQTKVDGKDQIRERVAILLENMKRRSNEHENGAENAKRKCVPSSSANSVINQEEQLEISLPNPNQPEPEAVLQDAQPSSSTANVRDSSSEDEGRNSEFVRVQVSTPTKKNKSDKKPRRTLEKNVWRDKTVIVDTLEGHEDLGLGVDVDLEADIGVTCSRDTTVLVWRLSSKELLTSLRGHTGAVSAVCILPKSSASKICESGVVCVSGSLDCSLKFWDVLKGTLIKSVYTYNGIKCLRYCQELDSVVTGTDGGKLEFFDVKTDRAVHSVKAHDDAITTIDVNQIYLSSGSRDGIIKMWQISSSKVQCLYVSDDVKTAQDDQEMHFRCILSLRILPFNNLIAYGDSGCNVKLLDWKNGILHKLPNHTTEIGFTDCISLAEVDSESQLLFASSYDLDSGQGHLNMFFISKEENSKPSYICSWTDEETSRIFGMAAQIQGRELCYVTVGKENKMWRTIERRNLPEEDAVVVQASVLALYSDVVIDSGSSDDEFSSTESDEEGRSGSRTRVVRRRRGSRISDESEERSGWGCNIL